MTFFDALSPLKYQPDAPHDALAFRHYNPDEIIAGKRMEEHLRFSIAYWHSFAWEGTDPFGASVFERPWHPQDTLERAKLKADAAFEMFQLLNVPYFCFHDADVRPETGNFTDNLRGLQELTEYFAQKMQDTGVKLLWGTANLFSHRRFIAGAATNPDPDIFAFAAATVRSCIDATHQLNGENYVLWGGREGYETLLNTDLKKEQEQMARFLEMVVEYKHKIGFKGTILIEPKPQEPSKHQYDYDASTTIGFLRKYDLHNDIKLNLEQGHAILAGHSFEHEIAIAQAEGMFGSIDMNRNDYQSGWDTDQFPNNAAEVALAYYYILKGGGFQTGGTNFDAKLRRQSIDARDLIAAHAGAMDICARGLKAAQKMLDDGGLEKALKTRYEKWDTEKSRSMLASDLETIANMVISDNLTPEPQSGKQEMLENYVNQFV